MKEKTTDPYGELNFAIGSEDDFYCFDFYLHGDGTITLHAVINSETGSFIQDAEPPVRVPYAKAVEVAKRMTDDAIDWLVGGGYEDNLVEHDTEGWNQDETYFWRSVEAAVSGKGPVPRIVENI